MRVNVRSGAALVVTAAALLAAASAAAYIPEGGIVVAGDTNLETPYADGVPATSSVIGGPGGLAVDPQGNLFFSEPGGVGRIRKVAPDGIITGVTGLGPASEDGGFAGDNGPASGAQFRQAGAVAVDGHGNIYVADKFNYRVRKIDATGVITTVAGNGLLLGNGLGAGVSGDGGKATDAGLFGPDGLAVDRLGNLYIADGSRIRKVDTAGIITTYAGNGSIALGPSGSTVSPQDALSDPTALAIVGDDMYITEYAGVRKIHLPDGVITNVAGTWTKTALDGSNRGDGGPATQATLSDPTGASADSHGNVFIADAENHAIREVTPDGIIRTIGTMRREVGSVVVDAHDDVYYTDPHLHLIVKLGGVRVSARKALPLPSNDRCTSHRAFPIRVRRYRGIAYTSATVAINGRRIPVYVYATRRLKLTKVGAVYLNQRRFRAFIDLRGRAKGTYRVRVTATTTAGRVLAATRTYHTCSRSGRLTGGIPRL